MSLIWLNEKFRQTSNYPFQMMTTNRWPALLLELRFEPKMFLKTFEKVFHVGWKDALYAMNRNMVHYVLLFVWCDRLWQRFVKTVALCRIILTNKKWVHSKESTKLCQTIIKDMNIYQGTQNNLFSKIFWRELYLGANCFLITKACFKNPNWKIISTW